MVETNNQNQFDGVERPLSEGEKTSNHFEEGKLSLEIGDFEFEDTDIINPSEVSDEPSYKRIDTPNPFGRTIQLDLVSPSDSDTPPDTLLATKEWQKMSGEFQKVTVNTDITKAQNLTDDPKTNIEIILSEEFFDEEALTAQIMDYLIDFFENIKDIEKIKTLSHKLDTELFWLIDREIRKPNAKIENIQVLFNVFCFFQNCYEDNDEKDEALLKYHREVLLPSIMRARFRLVEKLKELEPKKIVIDRASNAWRSKNLGDALLSEITVGIYDYSSGRDLEEKMEIIDETIKKHANEALMWGKTIAETEELIEQTALKTALGLSENDEIGKYLKNLKEKIKELVDEVNKSIIERRKNRKSILIETAQRNNKAPGKAKVEQTGIKEIKRPSNFKSPSRWAKFGSTIALLTTIVFSAFSAKDSCEGNTDDSENDLIIMNKGENFEETFSEEEIIAEMEDVPQDNRQIVPEEESFEDENMIPTNLNEEWGIMAESDIFDFTASDKTTPVEPEKKNLGLSVFQEEILPGDGMYKFLKKWKEIRSMRNVEDPKAFDKYSDFELMVALAEWSDAKASELEIKGYKKIGKNLMLRRGRVVLLPEDASEILVILQSGNFEEEVKTTQKNYEKWRSEGEIVEDIALIPIELDEEWEKMAEDNDDVLIPIEVDDEGEGMSKDEELIPIDIDEEWSNMLEDESLIPIETDVPVDNIDTFDGDIDAENMDEDEALIPIEIDLEWEKMLDTDPLTLADDTNTQISAQMNELDLAWLEMDEEEDAELEMALNAMIK